jgi:hypothetical protein
MYIKRFLILIMAFAFILSACVQAPVSSEGGNEGPVPMPPLDTPEAITDILKNLAEQSGIDPAKIEIISFVETEWPNACLGLAGPDEMCAEVITPGWKIVLAAGEDVYEFHTDQSGANIRQK